MRYISCSSLDQFNDRLGRVTDVNELLTALLKHIGGAGRVLDKHFVVLGLLVSHDFVVKVDSLLQALESQLLSADPSSQSVILLSGGSPLTNCVLSLL